MSAASEPQAEETKLRIGGMALGNGLLLHGPSHWAAAVRQRSGDVAVASGKKARVTSLDSVPGVRGVVRLAESMAVIPAVKRALPEAQLPFLDRRYIGQAAAVTVVGSQLKKRSGGSFKTEALLRAGSLAPALLALKGGELAAYHGAEHKAVAAYEAGEEELASAPKEHDRCGSHLALPVLLSDLLGSAALRRFSQKPTPLATAAVSLASIGVAVELFGWMERNRESGLSKLLARPGYQLQHLLGTREPSADQLAVAKAALEELLRVEGAV